MLNFTNNGLFALLVILWCIFPSTIKGLNRTAPLMKDVSAWNRSANPKTLDFSLMVFPIFPSTWLVYIVLYFTNNANFFHKIVYSIYYFTKFQDLFCIAFRLFKSRLCGIKGFCRPV
jgi:hypothetical protein